MFLTIVQVALTSTSLAAWRDSLSIVDFLHCFAPLCDTQAVSLAELNYAAAWPLDSQLLPPLYTALLSRLLLELVRSPGCGLRSYPLNAFLNTIQLSGPTVRAMWVTAHTTGPRIQLVPVSMRTGDGRRGAVGSWSLEDMNNPTVAR